MRTNTHRAHPLRSHNGATSYPDPQHSSRHRNGAASKPACLCATQHHSTACYRHPTQPHAAPSARKSSEPNRSSSSRAPTPFTLHACVALSAAAPPARCVAAPSAEQKGIRAARLAMRQRRGVNVAQPPSKRPSVAGWRGDGLRGCCVAQQCSRGTHACASSGWLPGCGRRAGSSCKRLCSLQRRASWMLCLQRWTRRWQPAEPLGVVRLLGLTAIQAAAGTPQGRIQAATRKRLVLQGGTTHAAQIRSNRCVQQQQLLKQRYRLAQSCSCSSMHAWIACCSNTCCCLPQMISVKPSRQPEQSRRLTTRTAAAQAQTGQRC